jgi:predicted HicB family RNase H-like nuclease
MTYKGYIGSVNYSDKDQVFFGKIEGINGLVNFEGESVKELTEAFHEAVDDYLDLCAERGTDPERSYKGTFNIRIAPELHKSAAIYAYTHQISLNSVVEKALTGFIESQS